MLIGEGKAEETPTYTSWGYYCLCPPCHLIFFIWETDSTIRFERKGTIDESFIARLVSQELESHLEDKHDISTS